MLSFFSSRSSSIAVVVILVLFGWVVKGPIFFNCSTSVTTVGSDQFCPTRILAWYWCNGCVIRVISLPAICLEKVDADRAFWCDFHHFSELVLPMSPSPPTVYQDIPYIHLAIVGFHCCFSQLPSQNLSFFFSRPTGAFEGMRLEDAATLTSGIKSNTYQPHKKKKNTWLI